MQERKEISITSRSKCCSTTSDRQLQRRRIGRLRRRERVMIRGVRVSTMGTIHLTTETGNMWREYIVTSEAAALVVERNTMLEALCLGNNTPSPFGTTKVGQLLALVKCSMQVANTFQTDNHASSNTSTQYRTRLPMTNAQSQKIPSYSSPGPTVIERPHQVLQQIRQPLGAVQSNLTRHTTTSGFTSGPARGPPVPNDRRESGMRRVPDFKAPYS